VNGSGWIPVNFSQMSTRAPFGALPVDPINTTSSGNYYTYVTGGSWELNTRLESNKYGYNPDNLQTISRTDGGNNDYLYEVGTNLSLILDNENYLNDGDMELADTSNWADYGSVTVKEKVTNVVSLGNRSLHLKTAGYTGGTYQGISGGPKLPASKKVFIQIDVKTVPGKEFGWICTCSNLGCCWHLFFGGTYSDWTRKSTIDDISDSTGLTSTYYSQGGGADSEFWLDNVLIRPVY
jgi:hypothetical protein